DGATLQTALDALMTPPAADDRRSPRERRADALTEMARRQLDLGELPWVGGQKPHRTAVRPNCGTSSCCAVATIDACTKAGGSWWPRATTFFRQSRPDGPQDLSCGRRGSDRRRAGSIRDRLPAPPERRREVSRPRLFRRRVGD